LYSVDVTIIGAGAVGLAVGAKLSERKRTVLILEKNTSFGQEASSRNSEVIHSGLYYPKRSLKTVLCVKGRKLLYNYLKENSINHQKTGKIIVATNNKEISELEVLKKNGLENGVEGLRILDRKELENLEPEVTACCGLLSPETGIIDSHRLMQSFIARLRSNNATISYNSEVSAIKKTPDGYEVRLANEDLSLKTRAVINCAGISSDKISRMAGLDADSCGYRIRLSKGCYFRLNKKLGINKLIYPVPSAKLIDLGIHVTKDLSGSLRLGPDAEYVNEVEYSVSESKRQAFFDSAAKYLRNIRISDISPDTAGFRAKLQGPGEDFRDFVIKHENDKGLPGFINLAGIESPGLTSSLAIAEYVENILTGSCLI
jgi:L-2-hydroxyglutarate oxidase LhgO